ncbi:MAG: FAD binding domain-containing protein [Burkholderiaceae bacterium]|jgi:carbon-monoxide dehydrogenase medium subunit|nr:FAD binding domain-containing protein [Burkholderiaceae bacterium]
MKAAQFEYMKPATLAQALQTLAGAGGQAKLMAGSQSLGPMLNLRLARPAQVLDVSRLNELRSVDLVQGRVRVGASVTHAEIEDGRFELLRGHPVQEMAARIAYRSVRNRGTVGGSLAHADPAADWVLAARALNAQVEICAFEQAPRLINMQDFMLAAYTTVLGEGEVITALHLPVLSEQARWGYYKFCRKTGEFAEASCAAYFEPVSATAQIVVGALDGAPVALEALASAVARSGVVAASDAAIDAAIRENIDQLDTLGRRMAAAAVTRCLKQAFGAHA